MSGFAAAVFSHGAHTAATGNPTTADKYMCNKLIGRIDAAPIHGPMHNMSEGVQTQVAVLLPQRPRDVKINNKMNFLPKIDIKLAFLK